MFLSRRSTTLLPAACDINVSPDKRTILLHSEVNFLAALKVYPAPLCTLQFLPNKCFFASHCRLPSRINLHPLGPHMMLGRWAPKVRGSMVPLNWEVKVCPRKARSQKFSNQMWMSTRSTMAQLRNWQRSRKAQHQASVDPYNPSRQYPVSHHHQPLLVHPRLCL
jgi:hypothetical protein